MYYSCTDRLDAFRKAQEFSATVASEWHQSNEDWTHKNFYDAPCAAFAYHEHMGDGICELAEELVPTMESIGRTLVWQIGPTEACCACGGGIKTIMSADLVPREPGPTLVNCGGYAAAGCAQCLTTCPDDGTPNASDTCASPWCVLGECSGSGPALQSQGSGLRPATEFECPDIRASQPTPDTQGMPTFNVANCYSPVDMAKLALGDTCLRVDGQLDQPGGLTLDKWLDNCDAVCSASNECSDNSTGDDVYVLTNTTTAARFETCEPYTTNWTSGSIAAYNITHRHPPEREDLPGYIKFREASNITFQSRRRWPGGVVRRRLVYKSTMCSCVVLYNNNTTTHCRLIYKLVYKSTMCSCRLIYKGGNIARQMMN